MNGETLWLLWTSRGWDVPLAVAELLASWVGRDGNVGGVLYIDSAGDVGNEGLRNGVLVHDSDAKWINDYAPLLMALWILRHGVNAPPSWYTRFPAVERAVTDPTVIEWARRIKT